MSEELVCKECGEQIELFGKYAKRDDGTILCKRCFDRLIKEEKIK